MNTFFKTMAATAVAAVSLTGAAQAEGERYVLVSHAPDSDSWWNTIKNGFRAGGRADGRRGGIPQPAHRRSGRHGPDHRAGGGKRPGRDHHHPWPISTCCRARSRNAVASGIDVIIINSGTPDQARELGALMYVGQPEYDAGFAAGQRAAGDGVASFLCVNHYIAQPASAERCQGFADGLGVDLGNQMIDSGTDPSEIQNRVMAYLNANPDTDAVLTLGPTSADPTIMALEQMGLSGDIYFGTFDLGGDIVQAIEDGVIEWGIDQQPFLQAYLPVVVLTNYHRYGVLPGNNINSGPGFVTADGL